MRLPAGEPFDIIALSSKGYVVGQVIIRNLDDGIIERHRLRAKARGVSLEQQLRDVLASVGDKADFARESARIRAANRAPSPGGRWPTTEEMIRDDRDGR